MHGVLWMLFALWHLNSVTNISSEILTTISGSCGVVLIFEGRGKGYSR